VKYDLIKEILAFVRSYISDCSDEGRSMKNKIKVNNSVNLWARLTISYTIEHKCFEKNYIWIPGNFFKQDPVKEIIF